MAKTILMIGAFDTKGAEYAFLREQILGRGHEVLAVNTGVLGSTDLFPVDVEADEVAAAGGADLAALRAEKDRGEAMKAMGAGAPKVAERLHQEGRFDGIIGMGGTGGSAVVTAAMRALPVGVPKVCVSTAASGDTSAYVGTKDVTMIPSIVDVAGLNRISRIIFTRAAGAICGMVEAEPPEVAEEKPIITASICSPGRATRCSSSTPRAPAGGPWSRWWPRAWWMVSSTSPPPSGRTPSAAASSMPARSGWTHRAAWASHI
jgi:uncharacterized protein (UPF0261 family)